MFQKQAKEKLLKKFTAKNLESTILDITKLRTKYMDDMTEMELKELYYLFFPLENPNHNQKRVKQLEEETEVKKKRSIILRDAEYIGLYSSGNWIRFNDFMLNKSTLKKPLNKYKLDEFKELIKQFKSMRWKFDRNKIRVGTTEWFHFIGIKPSIN